MTDSPISRRDIFRLLAAASAAGAMLPKDSIAQAPLPLTRDMGNSLSDPDFKVPAGPWEKPLAESELATLAVLVDIILPGDESSPAPSKIGVPELLNEWCGAPYKDTIEDCEIIRGGISWINNRAHQLHGNSFTEISPDQQTGILDSICDPAKTTPELAAGHRFFKKLRMLTLGGYYSHSSTWKSLGYVGNIPIAGPYPGVPDEIIRILGLEDVR